MTEDNEKKINIKKILEAVVLVLFAAILIIFGIRIYRFSEKEFASELIWSDAAIETYNKSPDDFVIYGIPSASTTKGLDYTLSGNEITDTTNYTVSNMVYFEAVNEYELTVKYPVRELKDKNNTVPYSFVLEDGNGNRYKHSEMQVKTITGYVYCRIIYSGINIFKTNIIGMLIFDGDEIIDARTIYSTDDRISDNICVYNISYSESKNLYSCRFRIPISDEKIPDISLTTNNGTLNIANITHEKVGNYYAFFVECNNIDLSEFTEITLNAGSESVNIYDVNTDKTVYEDLSTDEYECAAYYVIADDAFITPVKVIEYEPPTKNE